MAIRHTAETDDRGVGGPLQNLHTLANEAKVTNRGKSL